MSNAAIRTEDLKLDGIASIAISIPEGSVAVVVTPKAETSLLFCRTVLGNVRPERGKIFLLGTDPAAISWKELLVLRQRTGIVTATGGLVSNLKIWENLTLPLQYHRSTGLEEAKRQAAAVMQQLSFTGSISDLPGFLPLYQKKLVSLGRGILSDPDLMIHQSPEQGLNPDEQTLYVQHALRFHRMKKDRTSVFITSVPQFTHEIPDAVVFELTRGRARC